MGLYLGFLLLSFLVNAVLYVPFINLLYKLKFRRLNQATKDPFEHTTPIFDKYHRVKGGTPVGGGLLIIVSTVILFGIALMTFPLFWIKITAVYSLDNEIKIVLFAFISFALLGLYDDIKKTFFVEDQFFGLRLRHKLVLEIILALILGYLLYSRLHIDILHIPFIGVMHLSWMYIYFAAFVIVAYTNAFNITDGLDGLATGLLMIALFAFWFISSSILDTPLSLFIAIWVGALLAFLYFNIYPARIFMGDVGALSFGATFAVIGLMLGKTFSLNIIGGVFVLEVASSLIQLLSKKFRGKKIIPAAPLHLLLQYRGWHEAKIVMRAWLLGAIFAIIGLLIAVIA